MLANLKVPSLSQDQIWNRVTGHATELSDHALGLDPVLAGGKDIMDGGSLIGEVAMVSLWLESRLAFLSQMKYNINHYGIQHILHLP